MLVPINSVVVPSDRQRKDLGDLTELEQSLRSVGLLNPIIVQEQADDTFLLIAGERRLTAARNLGWYEIEVRVWTTLSISGRQVLEFEENAKRKDLTWQEEVQAVAKYHELMLEADASWEAEATAKNLSISTTHFYRCLQVHEALQTQPALNECTSVRSAHNIVSRQLERKMDAAFDLIQLDTDAAAPEVVQELAVRAVSSSTELDDFFNSLSSADATGPAAPPKPARVIQADFLQWAAEYQGAPFNFIHCDFPYGVDMGTSKLQGSRRDLDRYDDTQDVYWALVNALFRDHRDKLIASSAHVMFWLSPNFLGQTIKKLYWLTDPPGQIRVDPWPLIWHKTDNKGLLPDPQRGTRHTYEMALHISFGDRKIVRPVAASVSHPLNKAEAVHLSEKPQAVLEHFFRLYVDSSTRMLDPTCGSGNALAVADRLGAESVFGLDKGDISNAERVLRDARSGAGTAGDGAGSEFSIDF